MRFLLGTLLALAVSTSAAASPSVGGGASQLVVHLDHASARAGDVVTVSVENRGPTNIVVSYAGGSNGCAVPRPQVSLVDSAHRLVPDDSPAEVCLAVMVPPGQVVLPAGSTEIVTAIDTKARKLAPGVYTVEAYFGVAAQPATLVGR